MKRLVPALLSFAMSLIALQAKDTSLAPDFVIVDASIHNMDKGQPTATAVAILQNHIAAVGSSAEIRKLAGPKTRVIDGKGKTVLPGFNDAHVHWLSGGFGITNVDLR